MSDSQRHAAPQNVATKARAFIVDPNAKVTAGATIVHGLRNLFRGCARYPKIATFTFGGAAIYAIAQITAATVLGWVTAHAMQGSFTAGAPQWGAIGTGIALLLGLSLARLVGLIGRRMGSGFMGFELFAESRRTLAQRYTSLPVSWHRRQNTGRLMAHVTSDVDAAWRVIFPFPFAVATVLMLVYAFWSIFRADVFLGFVGAVMFPLIISVNVVYWNKLMPLVRAAQALRSDVTRTAHESLEAANVVKVLGREDYEGDRFAASSHRLRDATIKLDFVRALFDPILDALPYVGVLAVVLIGGWRIENGAMATPTLVQVAYIFMIIGLPIRSFGWVLADLPRSVVGVARLNSVFEAESDQSFGASQRQGEGPAAVSISGVEFGFSGVPEAIDAADSAAACITSAPDPAGLTSAQSAGTNILSDFNFQMSSEPGRNIVAVVGATGSGKSTLTQLVARLHDPQRGEVKLDNLPLQTYAPGEVVKDVVLVLQDAFIFDDTVRGNLNLGAEFSDADLWWALGVAQARDFVRQLPQGLDTELGERGGSLSGGQRQRLALARALVRRPRLLILDDATSAVDPTVEAAILASLRESTAGMSLLLVAYRKATISLADEVVFMSEGRITARGTHQELLAHAEYRDLVNAYDEAAIAHQLLETERVALAEAERTRTVTGTLRTVPESQDANEPFLDEFRDEPEETTR